MMPSAPIDPPKPPTNPARPRGRNALTQAVLENHLASEVESLQTSINRGARWFYWVAALSVINSVISIYGGHEVFLAGLAISQLADAFAAHLGIVGPYLSIGVDFVVGVFLCGFGYLASHGSRSALIVGMLLYGIDGAIFVVFGAYDPALFHAFVLFLIGQGWAARRKLNRLRAESPTLAAAESAKS